MSPAKRSRPSSSTRCEVCRYMHQHPCAPLAHDDFSSKYMSLSRQVCWTSAPSSRLAFLRAFFFRYLYFLPLGVFLHFLFFRSSEPWPRQPRCGFRSFFFASVTLNGTAKHQLNTWSARRKHSHIAKITTKPDQGVVKYREPLASFPSFRHIGEG